MKVYILEDEINILQYIVSLVEKMPFFEIIGTSAEIAKAQTEFLNLKPELVLSDIQLKDGNSFDLFGQKSFDFQLIFITAHNQFAIQALNLGAFAYLQKPINENLFNETLQKCYSKQEQYRFEKQQMEIARNYFEINSRSTKKIALKSLDYTQIVNIGDIVYCQSDKGYTTFFINDNSKIVVSKVLKEYENILPENIFIRCHQSYLFNINYLKKYFRNGEIELTTGVMIPVSDRRRNSVINIIDNLLNL